MKTRFIALSVLFLLPALASAQERPEWAVAPDSSGIAYPRKPDDGVLMHVPGSAKSYTQAQIDDPAPNVALDHARAGIGCVFATPRRNSLGLHRPATIRDCQ
jgi:hypothetical protein